MTPTSTLLDRLATLLAQDSTTLAPASSAVKIHLAMAAFTPAPTLTIAGLVEATFTGYAALLAGVGNQQEFIDPVSLNRIIQLLEPAGGWHWSCSGSTGLPQTIYGYYATDNGVTTLYGSQLLGTPITLTNSGQGIDIPQVRFALIPGALI